jgi:hypothetical protein
LLELLDKVCDLVMQIEARFSRGYAKTVAESCFQRGYRACGGIYTLLTYEQFFTHRHT